MSLSTDEVRHVARLARLALTDEEVESLRSQLSDILTYVQKVGEVAASDVPPTAHAYPLRNVLRADEPRPSLTREEALSTAPEPRDGRFHVPRIVDDEDQEPEPDGGGPAAEPDGGGSAKPDGGGLT